jgi:hypothetical protein
MPISIGWLSTVRGAAPTLMTECAGEASGSGPPIGDGSHGAAAGHHETTPAVAEREINQQGFEIIPRDDRFIDRSADEDLWWLIVFRKP